MEIYLIQHGQARPEEEDPSRPLSDEGKAAMERVAARALDLGLDPDRIYHSGKLRAKQTAEILARKLGAMDRVEAQKGLDPLDDVKPTVYWLERQAARGVRALAIIGHLPFLDRLASLLIAGDEGTSVVAFQNAGLVKLIPKTSREGYAVQWILTPELA